MRLPLQVARPVDVLRSCDNKTLLVCLGLAAFLFFATPALAQDPPDIAVGLNPQGTYSGSDIDLVDLTRGRVNLHIPLVVDHSQRGNLNFTYSVNLTGPNQWGPGLANTQLCGPGSGCIWGAIANPVVPARGPFLAIDGFLTYQAKTKVWGQGNGTGHAYLAYDSDGAGHHLGPLLAPSTLMESIDGTGIQKTVDSSGNPVLINRAGIQYHPSNAAVCSGYVEDPNGNEINLNYSGTCNNSAASSSLFGQLFMPGPTNPATATMTDTLGRTWTLSEAANTSACPAPVGPGYTFAYLWNTPGPANINNGVRQFIFCYSSVPIQTHFNVANVQEFSGSWTLLTAIKLPNGTAWKFAYNTYGDPSTMYLPAGGTVSYAYTYSGTLPIIVASRTLFDGTSSHIWTYTVLSPSNPVTTVTDALNNDTVYTPFGNAGYLFSKIQYYSGSAASGILVKTVANTFQTIHDPFGPDIGEGPLTHGLLTGTTTTWPNNQVSQVTYTLDPGFTFNDAFEAETFTAFYGLVTSASHNDYGSGAPGGVLSTLNKSYLPLSNSSYLSANLLNLVSSQITLNGGGIKCAETDYFYDDAARLVSSGVSQQHVAAPSSVRGNLIHTTQQLSSTPCQASASWTPLNSYRDVYDTGVLQQSIDPLGHTTTYAYSGTYYGAYPTTVTNALNQSTTYTYDFNTGLITSIKDPNNQVNNQVTTYAYDVMERVASVQHPDGGQATISNQETSFPFTATLTKTATPSPIIVRTGVFDGLGRVTQTKLTSDPLGTDYVDTAYDALGRVHTVSNPHRSTSSSTDGTTTYAYDTLWRILSVSEADGSAVIVSYAGNTGTVTDEAGKTRKIQTDGLGRLTAVWEDPAGQNIQTTYSYDPLGNLTGVVQNGSRNRTFTYNSLSQLLTAANPESGTITYTYDNNGNLHTKTDARNITTTYSYDALNRNTQKSYSDGTPTATFQFDSGSFPGGSAPQNAIGRMALASTSNTMTSFSYDSMGRIARRDVCTPLNCGTGGWAFTNAYDLAGDVTQFNDGLLPCNQIFNQTNDGAGRVTQLTSTWSDATHPATFFTSDATLGYYPNGALRKAALGNGLTMASVYNNRLQPCLIDVNSSNITLQTCSDSTPTGNVLDLAMNYNAGADNGNVVSWNATGAQSFVRTYAYDSLNRLSTMADTATAQPCKGLSWTYDAWGNRTDQNVTAGSCGTFHAVVGTNNRLSGAPYQYDAAGNLIADGNHTYTYDAEDRLSQVDGGATASYVYDAFGRRAKRTVGGNSYEYVYNKDGQLSWELLNGHINRTYIRSNGWLLAEYFEGTTYFAHQDHLGSTHLLTRLDQSVRECDDYYPFGEANACGDATGTTLKFTGKERDSESGLDDFGARYYSSSLGRFMSADWSAIPVPVPYANLTNPQTLNLYAIARDNPTSFPDLDGHNLFEALRAAAMEAFGVDVENCEGGSCSGQKQGPQESPYQRYVDAQNRPATSEDNLQSSTTCSDDSCSNYTQVTVSANTDDSLSPEAATILGQSERLAKGPINVISAVGAVVVGAIVTVEAAPAVGAAAVLARAKALEAAAAAEATVGWKNIYDFSRGVVNPKNPPVTPAGLLGGMAGVVIKSILGQ